MKVHERKLANRISEVDELSDVSSVFHLNFEDDRIYKVPRSIFIGITTKSTLNRLLNNGSVSDKEHSKFYLAVHNYRIYLKERLPRISAPFLT